MLKSPWSVGPAGVLIAGCGYLGSALAARCVSAGVPVWALRRSETALSALQALGVRPIIADLLEPRSLENIPPVGTVVYCQAPSRGVDDYHRTYVEATQNLLRALDGRGVAKAVWVSSTGVYNVLDGSVVDENSPTGVPTARSSALLEAERVVLQGPIPAVVLRLSGIYGPGRNVWTRAKKGVAKDGSTTSAPSFSDKAMKNPQTAHGFTNRIHVEDAVSCIELLIERGTVGEIYLGSDDEPCLAEDFHAWLSEKSPSTHPALPIRLHSVDPRANQGKRCSNHKIKQLGLRLKCPTYREGYSDILSREGMRAR